MNGISQFVHANEPNVYVMPAFHTSVKRHSHEFYELVYVVDGFCLHTVDEKTTLLLEGDLFLLQPGQTHSYSGDKTVNIYNCLFNAEEILPALRVFPSLQASFEANYRPIHLTMEERNIFERLLSGMISELSNHETAWDTKLRAQLTILLIEYARCLDRRFSERDEQQSFSGYVAHALTYIDKHYADHITVREIAHSVGISPDYLTRQFRKMTSVTPQEYLKRFRFARAIDYLQSGCSISEAACRVGFDNLCHFSREFKKEMGVSPSQFKP